MTRTMSISGARGGHGASTVAAAIALFSARHQPTALVAHDPPDMAALLGVAPPEADDAVVPVAPDLELGRRGGLAPGLVVMDAGSRLEGPQSLDADEQYVVVRGPCYLALRSILAASTGRYDGVILINEPARSLRASDVAEVLGVPVVAQVTWHPAVARSVDAGVLPSRIHRLPALAPLRPLALAPPRRPGSRHALTAPTAVPDLSRHRHPIGPDQAPEKSGTDWPCSLFSEHGGRRPGGATRIGVVRGQGRCPRGGPVVCSTSANCDMAPPTITSVKSRDRQRSTTWATAKPPGDGWDPSAKGSACPVTSPRPSSATYSTAAIPAPAKPSSPPSAPPSGRRVAVVVCRLENWDCSTVNTLTFPGPRPGCASLPSTSGAS